MNNSEITILDRTSFHTRVDEIFEEAQKTFRAELKNSGVRLRRTSSSRGTISYEVVPAKTTSNNSWGRLAAIHIMAKHIHSEKRQDERGFTYAAVGVKLWISPPAERLCFSNERSSFTCGTMVWGSCLSQIAHQAHQALRNVWVYGADYISVEEEEKLLQRLLKDVSDRVRYLMSEYPNGRKFRRIACTSSMTAALRPGTAKDKCRYLLSITRDGEDVVEKYVDLDDVIKEVQKHVCRNTHVFSWGDD